MASSEPRRGEVWLVSLGAARPGEPGKNRPAVIVFADRLAPGSSDDLIVVVPLPGSLSPSGLRPEVITGEGVERPSRAVCGAIRPIARSRLSRRLGVLPTARLAAIDHALAVVLNLPSPCSAARRRA